MKLGIWISKEFISIFEFRLVSVLLVAKAQKMSNTTL